MYEAEVRETFSANLRRLLRERNLSQKNLSEKLNVSYVQVSRWATGKNPPSWEMVMALCHNLDVSVVDLFSNEKLSGVRNEDIELFKEFRKFQQAYTKAS